MASFRDSLLHDILSQPSAPFRERYVRERIERALTEGGVPHFQDPAGNLIVGAASERDYLALLREKSSEPVRIFIAHMDHPGFHGRAWKSPNRLGDELEFDWHGGSPTQDLVGANVWITQMREERSACDPSPPVMASGQVVSAELIESGRAIKRGVVRIAENQFRGVDPTKLFGGFSFRAPVWQDGPLFYTKAADDLVGAFCITSLALDHFAKPRKKGARFPFLGLLTRAEEVGYVGCIAHFELGWMRKARRPLVVVSLETSRALAGAEIGHGPVVRLGDKFTVFDAGALRVFSDLATEALPGKHQRRVMDGGTCEATVAAVYGVPCVGISVPLGNYHNQCFEGGPDARAALGPAPEFVHREDVEGLLTLADALMRPKLAWAEPWRKKARELSHIRKTYRALLRTGP